jgi:hypothetical protein
MEGMNKGRKPNRKRKEKTVISDSRSSAHKGERNKSKKQTEILRRKLKERERAQLRCFTETALLWREESAVCHGAERVTSLAATFRRDCLAAMCVIILGFSEREIAFSLLFDELHFECLYGRRCNRCKR